MRTVFLLALAGCEGSNSGTNPSAASNTNKVIFLFIFFL